MRSSEWYHKRIASGALKDIVTVDVVSKDHMVHVSNKGVKNKSIHLWRRSSAPPEAVRTNTELRHSKAMTLFKLEPKYSRSGPG